MKHSRVFGLGLLVVGVGITIGFVRLRGARDTAQRATERGAADEGSQQLPLSPSDRTDELLSLKRQVQALQLRVLALEVRLAGRQQDKPTSQATPPNNAVDRTIADDAWREHLEQVEADFRREATDPSWSGSMTDFLASALRSNDDLRNAAVSKVECRGRTCRIELSESGPVMRQLPALMAQFQDRLPVLTSGRGQDGAGHGTRILYLSRAAGGSPATADTQHN